MYLSTDQFAVSFPVSLPPLVETLLERGSGEQNEDVLLRGDNLFGVFDGATSLGNFRDQNGITGGLRAARIAADTFTTGDGNLRQLADEANRRLRAAQIDCGIPLAERQQLWSTSLAVISLEGASFSYCHTGDSMILLLHADGGHTLLSPELDIDRETLTLWRNTPPAGQAIHTCLADQIVNVRLQMNVSYGVLNGEPEAMNFFRCGRLSLDDITDILLFTDGLALPKADPEASTDWLSFIDLYREGGLTAVRDHVRSLQRRDPECRRYPRFKMHDDIAAIAIHLTGTSPVHRPRRSSRIPFSNSLPR